MIRRALALPSFVAMLAMATPSLADEGSPTAPVEEASSPAKREPEPKTESYWYGWQTMIVDLTSLGTLIVTSAAIDRFDDLKWLLVPAASYVVGGPVIHIVHGEGGRAAGSAALRIGAPLLVGGIAGHIGANRPRQCSRWHEGTCEEYSGSAGAVEMIVGGTVGVLSAMLIDALALAHGRRPVVVKSATAFSLQPVRGGLSAGIGGTF